MSVETKDMQNTGGLRPEYQIYERQKCFVGHSHEAEWRDDILGACAEVLSRFGLEPWYAADHFDPTKPLRDKVVELIANARYGIYDLSSWQDRSGEWHLPHNVLIEVGMAIVLNRPALLLRHTSNKVVPLSACLQGVDMLEFAGETTLKMALEERLLQWFNVPPDRDWLNRFCIFGNRVCDFREEHPRARQWGHEMLRCHVCDGLDRDHSCFQKAEREEIQGAFEDVFSRYSDLVLNYLDELSPINGYRFTLCSHCQNVRSTPFAVYRILPHTPTEVFITIGMSIALETLFEYDIPKMLLVRQEQDLPSLLRGYEVVEAVSSSEVKRKLKAFVPAVMQKVRETVWKPRPLPFVEVSIPLDVEQIPLVTEALASLRTDELSELLRKAAASASIHEFVEEQLKQVEGKLPSVEVNEILRQQVGWLRGKGFDQSLDCRLNLATDDTTRVCASREWLQRVFEVLIENAIRAMANVPNQQLVISTQLSGKGFVRIAFSDTGPGIPSSMLPKLFQEPIEKREGEIGIGLPLARTIIETFGGTIKLEVTSQEGTTMAVLLPVEAEESSKMAILSLGERVRRAREEHGLSLAELAQRGDISRPYLWQLEAGRSRPSLDVTVRIARALEMSVGELLGEEEELTPSLTKPQQEPAERLQEQEEGTLSPEEETALETDDLRDSLLPRLVDFESALRELVDRAFQSTYGQEWTIQLKVDRDLNRLSLGQLLDLVRGQRDIFGPLFTTSGAYGALVTTAREITTTRNALAHGVPGPDAAEMQRVQELVERLLPMIREAQGAIQVEADLSSPYCFVIMPFVNEFMPVFESIRAAVENFPHYRCVRADSIVPGDNIARKMQQLIDGAALVIADISGRNPNVMMEMGTARGAGKPLVIISQSPEDVPSDMRSSPYILYTLSEDGLAALQRNIAGVLTSPVVEVSLLPIDDLEFASWNTITFELRNMGLGIAHNVKLEIGSEDSVIFEGSVIEVESLYPHERKSVFVQSLPNVSGPLHIRAVASWQDNRGSVFTHESSFDLLFVKSL
jgi:transcriptional regulator with XRE-family HTH domain